MNKYLSIALRAIVAIILLQTLFFKFSAHEESVYIFSTIGLEPVGRVGSGIIELIASILLFVPRYVWAGAFLSLGAGVGASFFHLTSLGIVVKDDGGALFAMALVIVALSAIILWNYRKQIPFLKL